MHRIQGRLVNILEQTITPVEILIENDRIGSITPIAIPEPSTGPDNPSGPTIDASSATFPLPYILPGFIDAHVHIESSLLIPSEFARLAVVHGTIATVSDPHEIANVNGLEGVEFMIRNGRSVPFYFNFGAPSCVPATAFETAGATLDAGKVARLLASDDIKYLSEMMNFPGVLNKDPEVMEKIKVAQDLGKPIDGHAPGLRGQLAKQYIDAGMSTDHECFTAEEALDKLRDGMKILIREGSAARNFDALIDLLNDYPEKMMFCSDDKHPDSLLAGHIDQLCARAVAKGIDVFKVLRAACINPVLHYKLDSGLLRPGDPADFILVQDLQQFRVLATYIKGQLVAENGYTRIGSPRPADPSAPAPTSSGSLLTAGPINNFNCQPRVPADFAYPLDKWGEQENVEQVYVIEALDGQLITNKLIVPVADVGLKDGYLHSNPEKDILKLVVVNRYQPAPVAKSFIRNFGLTRGAIASSVAHDSHNIIAVGLDDDSICKAVNLIIAQKGGLSCVDPGVAPPAGGPYEAPAPVPQAPVSEITGEPLLGTPAAQPAPPSQPATSDTIATPSSKPLTSSVPTAPAESLLPLPVAGLMSLDDGYRVAEAYTALDRMAKGLGSSLGAPFMTLSFMALLVIPHLKLGDLGLFDGDTFKLL